MTEVPYQPHGTLQMVNRPLTIDTINDYMHKRNGQKQEHHQRADPEGPKARMVMIRRHCAVLILRVVLEMMMMMTLFVYSGIGMDECHFRSWTQKQNIFESFETCKLLLLFAHIISS